MTSLKKGDELFINGVTQTGGGVWSSCDTSKITKQKSVTVGEGSRKDGKGVGGCKRCNREDK